MLNKMDINSREMWKCLKELTNLKEEKGEIKTVKITGIYDNDQEIAENLNSFFVSGAKGINESIEQYKYRGLYPAFIVEWNSSDLKWFHPRMYMIFQRN